jgi:hypothetical protein
LIFKQNTDTAEYDFITILNKKNYGFEMIENDFEINYMRILKFFGRKILLTIINKDNIHIFDLENF